MGSRKSRGGVGSGLSPKRNKCRKRRLEQQLPLILLVYLLLGRGKQKLLMILFLELFSNTVGAVWLRRMFNMSGFLTETFFLSAQQAKRNTEERNPTSVPLNDVGWLLGHHEGPWHGPTVGRKGLFAFLFSCCTSLLQGLLLFAKFLHFLKENPRTSLRL